MIKLDLLAITTYFGTNVVATLPDLQMKYFSHFPVFLVFYDTAIYRQKLRRFHC